MESATKSLRDYFTPGGIDRAIPEDEWHQERAREETYENVARTMLESGYTLEETSKISKIPIGTLKSWQE